MGLRAGQAPVLEELSLVKGVKHKALPLQV